jgi:hypothetical protein
VAIISGGSVIEGAISRSATERSGVYEYDFAVSGGAISTINLVPLDGSSGTIPSGAVITDTVVEVLTAVTSGGAGTAALKIEAANDVVNATVVSGAPWSTTGRKAGIPLSAATSLKTTAARTPAVVIAAFAATAGKFRLYVSYYV